MGFNDGFDVPMRLSPSDAYSAWSINILQVPGVNRAFGLRIPIDGLKVIGVHVAATAVGASALGTYLLDVEKNGATILTAQFNLESLVANTWSALSLKTDNTVNLSAGDGLLIRAISSNVDLTGFTSGVDVTVMLGSQ